MTTWDRMKWLATRARHPRGLQGTANGRLRVVKVNEIPPPRFTGGQRRAMVTVAFISAELAVICLLWWALK